MTHIVRGILIACTAALVSACAVGPNYNRPAFDPSVAYKEDKDWKPSEPGDVLDRGNWWEIYDDEVLNGLEARIDISNQTVRAAEAAFEESRALVRQAQAGFWPQVSASGGRQRSVTGTNPPRTVNSVGVSANWDIDVWGQIRRSTESN
jgi:outer membrane protein TolC